MLIEVPIKVRATQDVELEEMLNVNVGEGDEDSIATIDTDKITYFYPCDEKKTTVFFCGGDSLIIELEYNDFKVRICGH